MLTYSLALGEYIYNPAPRAGAISVIPDQLCVSFGPKGALAPEGQTIRTNWSGMTDFAPARGSDCSYHIHTHIMHCWQTLFHFNRLQFKSKSNSDQ